MPEMGEVFPTVKCRNCGGGCPGVNRVRFRRLRELLGFSQRLVAKETGYSYTYVQELEKGTRQASPHTAQRLQAWAEREMKNWSAAKGEL